MRIRYSPLIDAQVQLSTPSMDFDGVVTIPGVVKGKTATMTLSLPEALKLQRDLQQLGLEEQGRILGLIK